MEFVDTLLNRIEGENELKRPLNALICFSRENTGKALVSLINKMVRNKPDRSSITLLNLIDAEQACQIRDTEAYKSELFSDLVMQCENNKLSVRTFVRQSENYVDDILHTAEEFNCNLILLGIGSNVLNPLIWNTYSKLKDEIVPNETDFHRKLGEKAIKSMQNVSVLLSRNCLSTGIFAENNYTDANNVFVPILTKEDAFSFPYFYQLAKNQDVTVTVWDAIGLIKSDAKFQKLFQFITKRNDGRVKLWNNDKKIEPDFILRQDLMIIGLSGWEKLISSALSWAHHLPSALIIKDKQRL